MASIEIVWLEDTHHCETCGTSYADGARIRIDGDVALELIPHAHCLGGDHFDRDDIYKRLIEHLGHTISEG